MPPVFLGIPGTPLELASQSAARLTTNLANTARKAAAAGQLWVPHSLLTRRSEFKMATPPPAFLCATLNDASYLAAVSRLFRGLHPGAAAVSWQCSSREKPSASTMEDLFHPDITKGGRIPLPSGLRVTATRNNTALLKAYRLLGLDPDADRKTAKEAFREAVKRTHPDRTKRPTTDALVAVLRAWALIKLSRGWR